MPAASEIAGASCRIRRRGSYGLSNGLGLAGPRPGIARSSRARKTLDRMCDRAIGGSSSSRLCSRTCSAALRREG